MRVGLAGLGRIGPFHAATVAALGHEVVVCDVRSEPAGALEALAAFRVAEAAQRSLETGLPVSVADVEGAR